MANDDKLDNDSLLGMKDVASQAARFNRVNDILQRAISRYQQILADVGTPSNDPTVQAALQNIVNSAGAMKSATNTTNGIIIQVLVQPGPPNDPAVRATIQLIANVGNQIAQAANTALGGGGLPAP